VPPADGETDFMELQQSPRSAMREGGDASLGPAAVDLKRARHHLPHRWRQALQGGHRHRPGGAAGEFVSIVGPTGCGKSTLLNAAAGLLVPSAGTVGIFGKPLSGLNRRAGYLFQADALMPWKTALDNVKVALEPMGVPTRKPTPRRANGSAGWACAPSSIAIRICSQADSASASASRRC
jgi:NitT/TauT family transport system ATP-binding protein